MHWTVDKCPVKGGHFIDQQGYCFSCGAQQVPDVVYVIRDIPDRDVWAIYSTLERAEAALAELTGVDEFAATRYEIRTWSLDRDPSYDHM